jgi:Excalibur calcium-binding domain
MKKLLTVAVIAALGWYGLTRYQSYSPAHPPIETKTADPSQAFSCDARKRCPQMESCEEATYFLRNCPGVEMDGDGDGVPCESQWCGGG